MMLRKILLMLFCIGSIRSILISPTEDDLIRETLLGMCNGAEEDVRNMDGRREIVTYHRQPLMPIHARQFLHTKAAATTKLVDQVSLVCLFMPLCRVVPSMQARR